MQVWDETRTTALVRQGVAGMIFLDETAEEGSCNGRKRFTLAHECSHLILHKHLPPSNGNQGVLVNSRSKHQIENRTEGKGEDWWVEWQADNMAAYLLMPTPSLKVALPEVWSWHEGKKCVDFDRISHTV